MYQPKARRHLRASFMLIVFSYLIQLVFPQASFLPQRQRRVLGHGGGELYPPLSPKFWTSVIICTVCVIVAGFASGMTVGYTSIDQMDLKVRKRKGTQREKEQARAILPVIENHHMLLSTLLLTNAVAMESLPIFLNQIVPALAAVLISTGFVVIVGEILPQAYCTGPSQLNIAEKAVPIMKLLTCVLYPLVYPTAKALDWILGEHSHMVFPKRDLRTLIEIHQTNGPAGNEGFNRDEVLLIKSLLDTSEEKVGQKCHPLEKVYMLSTERIFDRVLIAQIKEQNYSEVPIYVGDDKNDIMGVLRTKNLLVAEEKHMGKKIGKRLPLQEPLIVAQDTSILEMLYIFQEKRATLAFVCDQLKKAQIQNKDEEIFFSRRNLVIGKNEDEYSAQQNLKIIGIICLKDVFEEILDIEAKDFDKHQKLLVEVPRYYEKFRNAQSPDSKSTAFQHGETKVPSQRRIGRSQTQQMNSIEEEPQKQKSQTKKKTTGNAQLQDSLHQSLMDKNQSH